MLRKKNEFALLDLREEGVFSGGHLLFGCCLPLSQLELRVRDFDRLFKVLRYEAYIIDTFQQGLFVRDHPASGAYRFCPTAKSIDGVDVIDVWF